MGGGSGFIWASRNEAAFWLLSQNGKTIKKRGMEMKRSVRWVVLGVLMVSVAVLSLSTTSSAQIGIGISVRIGPPALPVYAQPICPGPGFLWTPGYWAWNDVGGYYWVPGTWVVAPVGMLWTPGYWGWGGAFYAWHPGYWGRHVGFYGGINYGYGYGGVGFFGGEWRGGGFFYNRSVVNVNVTNVTNVYSRTVVVNNTRNVSFNGPGGIEARPTREEESYSREPHTAVLSSQTEHEHAASQNRQLFASENHGRPAVAATARPGEFSGHNVERAKAAGEPYHAPKMSPQEARVSSQGNRGSNESGHNPEMRNSEPGNRGQMASRENSNPTKQERAMQQQDKQAQKQAQKEQKQAQAEQKRVEKANREQAKAEQKRNAHEPHR
jgi:WXXGXW repeat (2 copies)